MSANAVWDSYVENSGIAPPNAFKLIVYSRRCKSLKTLTFDEAKHLIDIHNNNKENTPSKSSKNTNKPKKKSNKNKLKSNSDYDNHISSNKSLNKSNSNSKKKVTHTNHTNKHQSNKLRSHSITSKSKKQSVKKKLNKHTNKSQQHLSTNYRSKSKSKTKTNTINKPRSKSTSRPKTIHNNERVSLKQKHKKNQHKNHKMETIKNQKIDGKPNKKSKNKIRSKSICTNRTNVKHNNTQKHVKHIQSDKRKNRKHKIRANSTIAVHSYDKNSKYNKSDKNKNKKHKLLPNNAPNMKDSLSTDSYNINRNKNVSFKRNKRDKIRANSISVYDENNSEQKQIKFRKKNKDKKRVKSLWTYDKSVQSNDNISEKQVQFKKKKKDKIRAKSVCTYNGNFDYDEKDMNINAEKQSINTFFNVQKKVQRKRNNSSFNPKKLQKISTVEIKKNLVDPAPVQIGDAVLLTEHREGIVKYIGNVHFADGIWFGIELINGAVGAHDGIIDKQRYFKSPPYRGIFVQGNAIRRKVRHRDYHSSPKLRRRASLEQIARIKDSQYERMNGINELDNVTVDVLDSDECFIVKEGIFKKMGAINKGFKTRWFKLYTHKKISYFELNSNSNGPKGKEKGCVELRDVLNVNKKKTNIIEMETKERKWVFKYNTCDGRDDWYHVLKQICVGEENVKQNKKRKKYKYRQKAKNTSLPFNLVIGTPVHISNAEFDVDYV